jgi:hypothetical protein
MQETIFKPKYPPRFLLGLVIIILIEAFMLWNIISNQDRSIETVFGAGFFGLMILVMPFVFIRRIVFENQSFAIEKYLLPSKTIEYSDVVDIGNTLIKTRQGNIPIQAMVNSDELITLLNKLLNEGKINSYQIENKLVGQEVLSRKAVMPATIISIILWVATLFFFPYEKSMFRDLSFLLFWIPIYILVYRFMKKKVDNQ